MQNNLQLLHNNNTTKTHVVEFSDTVYPTLPLIQDTANENLWYLDGVSSQSVTSTGKNLWRFGDIDTSVRRYYDSTSFIGYIDISPNKTYTISALSGEGNNNNRLRVFALVDKIENITYPSASSSATLSLGLFDKPRSGNVLDAKYFAVFAYNLVELGASIIYSGIQIEVSDSKTEYEPFIPNSPSIDYPSQMANTYKSGDYQLVVGGKKYHYTLKQDLESSGGISDRLIVDLGRRECYVRKAINNKTLNGSEAWVMSQINGDYIRFYFTSKDDVSGSDTSINCICDKLKNKTFSELRMTVSECCSSWNNPSIDPNGGRIDICILSSRISKPNIESFKTWLSNNPIQIKYQVSETQTTVQPISEIVEESSETLSINNTVNDSYSITIEGNYEQDNYKVRELSGSIVEVVNNDENYVKRIVVEGKTEQKSEWYSANGLTSQATTVMGKNLFDKNINKQYIINNITDDIDKSKFIEIDGRPNCLSIEKLVRTNGGSIRFITPTFTDGYITISFYGKNPSSYANSFMTVRGKSGTDIAYINIPPGTNEWTKITRTVSNVELFYWYCYNETETPIYIDFDTIQIEYGNTATTYTPFIPNSPSPDYSSPMTNSVVANTYKVTTDYGIYQFTLDEDLRGIGNMFDSIEIDKVSGRAWIVRKNGRIIFNGIKPWSYYNNPKTNTVSFIRNITDAKPSTYNSSNCMTNVFKAIGSVIYDEEGFANGENSSLFFIRINKSRIGWTEGMTAGESIDLFRNWLSSNNLEIIYQLANPTRTPLTVTKVNSSNATELPVQFLTSTPSADYFSTVYSAEGKLVSRGKNLWHTNVSYPFTTNGITVDYNPSTQEYTFNGTGGMSYYWIYTNGSFLPNIRSGDKISMRAEITGGSFTLPTGSLFQVGGYNNLLGKTSWVGTVQIFPGSTSFTSIETTTRDDMNGALFWVYNTATFNNLKVRVHWEKSTSTIPKFEPYYNQEITLPTLKSINKKDTYVLPSGLYEKRISDWIELTGNLSISIFYPESFRNPKVFSFHSVLDTTYLETPVIVQSYGSNLFNNSTYRNKTVEGCYCGSNDKNMFLSIPMEFTGFSEPYTPSYAEVKSYFYGWKMYNADGTTPYIKSEIPYNPTTWAEWYLNINSTIANNELSCTLVENDNHIARYNYTNFKPSTKYGLLINITEYTVSNRNMILNNNLTGNYTTIYQPTNGEIGNNKVVFTTQSEITNNNLSLYTNSIGASGIIKFKDIRVFELPTGSQIESDFNTLTADQLSAKYTFNGLCTKYWKKLVGTEAEIKASFTSTMPTASYTGFTPYKMCYELSEPIKSYVNPTVVGLGEGTKYITTDSHVNPNLIVGYKVKDSSSISTDITAPTYNYPSEIRNTGDNGSFDLVSSGKNLFDYKAYVQNGLANGLTSNHIGLLADGRNGLYSSTIAYMRDYFTYLEGTYKANTQYTISFVSKLIKVVTGYPVLNLYIYYTDSTSSFLRLSEAGNTRQSVTSISGKTIRKITLSGWENNGLYEVWDIQVEEGVIATPYYPYSQSTQTFPYKLRSTKDIHDKIVIDNINKTAKLIRNVGEFTITGNEQYINVTDYGYGYYHIAVINQLLPSIPMTGDESFRLSQVVSNYFRTHPTGEISDKYCYLGRVGSWDRTFRFGVKKSDIDILPGADRFEKVRNWIKRQINTFGEMKYISIIETPTETVLDYNTVIQNLKTFYPYTDITTDNVTVEATLSGKYRILGV